VPREASKAVHEDLLEFLWFCARGHQAHAQNTRGTKRFRQVLCAFSNDAAACGNRTNVLDEIQKDDFLPLETLIHAFFVLDVNRVEPMKPADDIGIAPPGMMR